jgi:hypothetical protein
VVSLTGEFGGQGVLGTDHPDALTSRDSLAFAYGVAGRTAEPVDFDQ